MKGCGGMVGKFRCCTVVRGDCLKLMRSLPTESVDIVVTDPPYGIEFQSKFKSILQSRIPNRGDRFEKLENDDNDSRFRMYRKAAVALKQDSAAVVFCSFKNYAVDYLELQKRFTIRNAIVWFKGGGGIGDLSHSLSTDYEMAIVAHKGKCRIRGKREGSVWAVGKLNPNRMEHATEKPVPLFEKVIAKFSDAGALVLDPYCGSGNCLVAARRLGRHFLGFELDVKYARLAADNVNGTEPVPHMRSEGNGRFDYFDVLK